MSEQDSHGHDHGHEDHVEVEPTVESPVVLEDSHGHEGHDHSGLEGLWEVMFGWEHVIAEVFWNSVWLLGAFAIGRFVAFRKVHEYIDKKHGISHDKPKKKGK